MAAARMSPTAALMLGALALSRHAASIRVGTEESSHIMDEAEGGDAAGRGDASGCTSQYRKFDVSGAGDKCRQCMRSSKCKWCPLDQTCVASGLWTGKSCPVRPYGYGATDKKIKSQRDCGRRPPWAAVLDEAYGPDWPSMNLEDAKQCIQWALGWPVTKASAAKGKTPEDEAGRWACVSALLREGILATLGAKPLKEALTDRDIGSRKGELSTIMQTRGLGEPSGYGTPSSHGSGDRDDLEISSGQLDAGSRRQSLLEKSAVDDWYNDQKTWEPSLCSILWLKLKAEKSFQEGIPRCYVRAWKLQQFQELRDAPGPLGESFNYTKRLIESMNSGPLIPMKPGAGKSGSGFAKTTDNLFKVKMGLVYNMRMNEPKNLMQLVEGKDADGGKAPSLAEHLRTNPDSLINRYHGMLKIALGHMRSYVVVMDDAFYDMDLAAEKAKKKTPAVSFTRYDLKGSSRNQNHMRKTGFCLVNGDFMEREQGLVHLRDAQCLRFRSALEADVAFLGKHKMIDYSILLLSVMPKKGAEGSPADWPVKCKPGLGEPFCIENEAERRLYTFSIIDFINDKNHFKQAESVLWGGKFEGYGNMIIAYAKKMCPTTAETALKSKTKMKAGKLSEEFKKIDADGDGKVSQEQVAAYLQQLGVTEEGAAMFFGGLDRDEKGLANAKAFQYLLQ